MDVAELLAWFTEAPTDPHRLRSLGSSLGVELSRRRLDHLGAAMTAMARVGHGGGALAAARLGASSRDPGFQAGYLTAVEDLVRAFQAELGEEESERELAHYARTEPHRGVLIAMAGGAETSTEIAAAMGKHKSSASRALAALREVGLVASYSAPDGNDRLRPHALTMRGQRVLAEVRGRRVDGAGRGQVASGSSDKALVRKRTPGKGQRAPVAAAARRGR